MVKRARWWWWAAGLVVMVGAAFFPIIFNGFVWDDDVHIVENMVLKTWGGVWTIWTVPDSMPQFYPVYHTVLWAGYRMWGDQPMGFHLLSMGLQAVNGILLWRLLRGLKVRGAWFAAALFAIHPMQVETVAWAMEVKSVLSGMFYFLALSELLPCWGILGERSLDEGENWKRYGKGMLLFLMSLLCKSVTATMPAVILLVVWWKRGRITWREVWRGVPLFLVGALAGLFTAVLERSRVGAEGADWGFTFVDRVLIASKSLCMYAGKLVWPHPLNFFYYRWKVDAGDWGQYGYLFLIVVVVAGLWVGRRWWGRGALAGVLFFMGTLFPALGFSNVYPMRFSFVADHFQYLACIGIFAVASSAGWWMVQGMRRNLRRGLQVGIGGAVLVVFGAVTFGRCFAYRDAFTLYAETVRTDWRVWVAQNLLATEFALRKDSRKEAEHAAYAEWMKPEDVDCREMLTDGLYRIGETELAGEMVALRGDDPDVRRKGLEIVAKTFERLGEGDVAEVVRGDLRGEGVPGPTWGRTKL